MTTPVRKQSKRDQVAATRQPKGAQTTVGTHAGSCSCGTHTGGDGRKAVAVDAGIKTRNTARLRRIEGQVRGIQAMIDGDRYCADILVQISATQEALRSVSRELMRNHLKNCAASAIRNSGSDAENMYDELVDLIYKHNR